MPREVGRYLIFLAGRSNGAGKDIRWLDQEQLGDYAGRLSDRQIRRYHTEVDGTWLTWGHNLRTDHKRGERSQLPNTYRLLNPYRPDTPARVTAPEPRHFDAAADDSTVDGDGHVDAVGDQPLVDELDVETTDPTRPVDEPDPVAPVVRPGRLRAAADRAEELERQGMDRVAITDHLVDEGFRGPELTMVDPGRRTAIRRRGP